MYKKLIFRNARKSAGDYLIYLVTMTICVTMFYAFLSVSSRFYHPDIGLSYDFTLLSDGMKIAVLSITLLLLFLIRYVNSYMLRCKKKEFALQAIMGMEQKTISWIFFGETFLMGIISILCGIFLGVFCSQFITARIMDSYGKPYKITWTLFPDTVLLTICFFVLSLLFVGMFNIRTIRKIKLIDMLNADKENEPSIKKSRWMPCICLLFLCFILWELATGIQKVYFYYDSRFVLPVKLMFMTNILFPALTVLGAILWCVRRKKKIQQLVFSLMIFSLLNTFAAASVPVMAEIVENRYYLPWGIGTINQYMMFMSGNLLFFLCAVIYLFSYFLAARKEKSPEIRYKKENLFFFGQMISRLSTTYKTMTLISITLTVAICFFVAAPILVGWASGYLDSRSMYDIQISSSYNDMMDEKIPSDNYEPVTDFMEEHGISTEYDCTLSLYLPEKSQYHNRTKHDFPAVAVSLSDYNRIREMLGYTPVTLKENEFTTQWTVIAGEEERNAFLKSNRKVTTDAGTLTAAEKPYYTDSMGESLFNSYTDVTFVFPDKICEKLFSVKRNRYIQTEEPLSYADAKALEQLFTEQYPEESEEGMSYYIRMSTLQINSTKASNFVLETSMIYGAIVLMVICLTILALQQLLDASHYSYRFSVLRKIGVEEKSIRKLMIKQLGVWFGLPICTAVFVSVAFLAYFIKSISAEISAYIGYEILSKQIFTTGGILLLLLICYFISTWILFSRSVER